MKVDLIEKGCGDTSYLEHNYAINAFRYMNNVRII
jgi:hypothetical protein